jgi:hypothetical protein
MMTGVLADKDAYVNGFVWVYGPARRRSFEPHLLLDGREFTNFDDPRLANDYGWPETSHYYPGDHNGCVCDFEPIVGTPLRETVQSTEDDLVGSLDVSEPSMLHDLGPNGDRYSYRWVNKDAVDAYQRDGAIVPHFDARDGTGTKVTFLAKYPEPQYARGIGNEKRYIVQVDGPYHRERKTAEIIPLSKVRISEPMTPSAAEKLANRIADDRANVLKQGDTNGP